VIALLVACALAASPDDVRVSHRKVTTADGAALALHRFLPPSGGTHAPAVLLVADVGFGRTLYDYKQAGLARWLAAQNRAVYVAELRGQGASSPGMSLRSLVHLDLPAVAAAIAREHPGPIDLVAHGYVGALALAATTKELPVRRVVALQTPALMEPPTELVESFLSTGGAFSSLASSPSGFEAFQQLFAMASDVDPALLRGLAGTTRDLSRGVSAELLAWMQTGDLPLDDGTTVMGRLREFDRPTLLMFGLADGFAPSEACAPLRELVKGKVEIKSFSRVTDDDDFAHVSLVHGKRAPRRVYPAIAKFLEAR
jgi:pimeloyl-ACP methyl ester carboxylesterase